MAATPKHYVANDSETERFTMSAEVSEQALREVYLLGFEQAITEAHVWLVMSAYNSINGVTATEHELLETPLNTEWCGLKRRSPGHRPVRRFSPVDRCIEQRRRLCAVVIHVRPHHGDCFIVVRTLSVTDPSHSSGTEVRLVVLVSRVRWMPSE